MSKFKVGDKVRCVNAQGADALTAGAVLTVDEVKEDRSADGGQYLWFDALPPTQRGGWDSVRFELVIEHALRQETVEVGDVVEYIDHDAGGVSVRGGVRYIVDTGNIYVTDERRGSGLRLLSKNLGDEWWRAPAERPTFKVGDRVRVSNPENAYSARAAEYTVKDIEEDGTLDCGDASDGRDNQVVHPKDAVLVSSALKPEVDDGPPALPAKSEAEIRKGQPVARGVLDYFPDALLAVAEVSVIGNRQHNGDNPLHWAYGKSADAADCIIRHLMDRGTLDTDGAPHSAKVAWRALAMLQQELESKNPDLHAKRQAMRDLAAKGERP